MAKPGRKIAGDEPANIRFTILFSKSEIQELKVLASLSERTVTFLIRKALEEKYSKIFKAVK